MAVYRRRRYLANISSVISSPWSERAPLYSVQVTHFTESSKYHLVTFNVALLNSRKGGFRTWYLVWMRYDVATGFWRIGSWIGAIRDMTLFCGSDLDCIPISNLPGMIGMIGMAILWRATNQIFFGSFIIKLGLTKMICSSSFCPIQFIFYSQCFYCF
jgi:hypothetical protein